MTTQSTTTAERTPTPRVSTGRVLARTCAAEWTRLWTVRATRWSVVAGAVVMVGLGILLGFEAAADPPELQGVPAWDTARFIALPALFAFLTFAGTAVTADYATGGIVPTLQWTPRRGVVFAARTLVAVGTATVTGVLLALVAALAAATTSGSALTLPGTGSVDMLATVGFVLACGASLAVGLGFLLRNPAGVLVTVFLVILVLPLLLPAFGRWLTEVAEVLPGSGVTYLLIGEPVDRMTQTSSVVVLLVWAVGALVLGCLRLLRADANS